MVTMSSQTKESAEDHRKIMTFNEDDIEVLPFQFLVHLMIMLPKAETKQYKVKTDNMTVTSNFRLYEEDSINRSQTDIKCKTCDIQTLKKHVFLDISSTSIDTFVPLLYQCVETQVF
jgi:hypothetical protein